MPRTPEPGLPRPRLRSRRAVRGMNIWRRALAAGIALVMGFGAGSAVAAGSQYTMHRTSGISWQAELWVLMYCRKGYTAIHGGYAKPPSGLTIESSGPSRAGGWSMWAIEVRNTTSHHWLELHSWATCAKG